MREQYIEYRDGDALLEGFLCYDESLPGPRPAVLINHAWGGRDEFVERKARRLAWQGYACFAMDNFGKGKRGSSPEECSALMTPFMKDRAKLLKRLQSGLATVRNLPIVDARRVAAMGFCFGGLCALDLARADAEIRGAVSFHGMLKPSGLTEPKIRAKVPASSPCCATSPTCGAQPSRSRRTTRSFASPKRRCAPNAIDSTSSSTRLPIRSSSPMPPAQR